MRRRGLAGVFAAVVRRDLLLAVRRRSDVLTTFFFFVVVVSLFPLGIGPEVDTLRTIAPGVIWVAALLASMLALARLFAGDYADGTLEQLALAPQPLLVLVLGKIVAHWLVTGVPLVLIAPLLGLQFDLPAGALTGDGAEPAAGNSCALDDRCGGRSPDFGCARRRWPAGSPRPAPVHPGVDLRSRCGVGQCTRYGCQRAPFGVGRHFSYRVGVCTMGYCRRNPDCCGVIASCPTNSWPKTLRESTPCGVTNPRQVFNLAVVRALPDADFAGFPTGNGMPPMVATSASTYARVLPRISGTGH